MYKLIKQTPQGTNLIVTHALTMHSADKELSGR